MPGVKSRGTGTEACPVTNCPFVGPSRAMTVHWRSFHEESILLYLCPLPGCSWQTPKPQGLRQHWENRHQASRQQSCGLCPCWPTSWRSSIGETQETAAPLFLPCRSRWGVFPMEVRVPCWCKCNGSWVPWGCLRQASWVWWLTPSQGPASHTSSTTRRGPEGDGKEHPTTGGRRPGDGSRDGSFACSDSGDPWQETADMFGLSHSYRQLASLYASGSC